MPRYINFIELARDKSVLSALPPAEYI